MTEFFNPDGTFRLELFHPVFLSETRNLATILEVAQKSPSPKIESTHFLLALSLINDGFTQRYFRQQGLKPDQLRGGLAGFVTQGRGLENVSILRRDLLDASALAVIDSLSKQSSIDEQTILEATLDHLPPRVRLSFEDAGINLPEVRVVRPEPIDDNDMLRQSAFTGGAWRVLDLMNTEAEALGYEQMDPRHLLLGLLEFEGGATHDALYRQNLVPAKVQERIMANLRGRARQTRSHLRLHLSCMVPSLPPLFIAAANEAFADRFPTIAETHLLRAFLQSDAFALQLLQENKLDLRLALTAAREFWPAHEPQPEKNAASRPWAELQHDLENSLIGQQHVVGVCIPYIRRMIFDFRPENRPVGVFLFCGPSGTGKTQLAKAIAQAIFGSEDNLLMLEMGQFQTKESMNIFVGAPPGYVGYGQGKLTNGLRDKPHSVVLFDEVEKADAEVFDALLRFLDEGRIDDPAGPIRDGTNCIIILTSNVNTPKLAQLLEEDLYKKSRWEIRSRLRDALLATEMTVPSGDKQKEPFKFRPEFLNRIDEIVLFRQLSEDDFTNIAERFIKSEIVRLEATKQIKLRFDIDDSGASLRRAAGRIGHFCAQLDEGARSIFRVVQSAIVDPVVDFMTSGDTPPSTPITLDISLPVAAEGKELYADVQPVYQRPRRR